MLKTKKEHHLETTFQITSTFMKMDVCSKSVYENLRNVLYAQVRASFGKDLLTHIFCTEDESTCRSVSESIRRGPI